ncbi:hypothetical protein HU200_067576 [Digitaria exilis]|uniref:Uncharacterized protein n=1 Tax=Digitaria exilis TaxID=1010633 RepID=A0A835A4S8_9POAL|nr:hypothetical protein HU200_067576 [Digitaria exilis]
MAIPVARVHLAMAHAALPGLLPTPPKCAMLPLLPAAAPCSVIVLPSSPPKPSRADAAGRWDAHKIKRTGSPASTSTSSSSTVRASSSCNGSLNSDKKNLKKRTSLASSSNSRADSEERWDAHKKPPAASPASSSSSSSASSRSSKTKTRASSSSAAERWDAHKKPPGDELDDGESSSTGSNDVELGMLMPQKPTAPRSLCYAGPGFITSPEPSMIPLPSFLIRVA